MLATKTLALVIPGLLGPWPREATKLNLPVTSLQRLLDRATVRSEPVSGFESTLLQLFNVATTGGAGQPIAALTWLAEQTQHNLLASDLAAPEDGWWLRADPIHLRADPHQVLLYDGRIIGIDEDEAVQLTAEFNHELSTAGWRLYAPHPYRWYLCLPDDPNICTTPLPEVIGKDIKPYLPSGTGTQRWNALLTETQMLFHNSAVNAERDHDNQPAVNSLWLWGGGLLPTEAHNPAATIYADDSLTQGLALCAGSQALPLPVLATTAQPSQTERGAQTQDVLAVLETTRYYVINDDLYRWCDWLESLEETWFTPCLEALTNGTLEQLTIYPCNGYSYHVSRAALWRFWRRRRVLDSYLR